MLSKQYLELTPPEKVKYIGRITIMAQSAELYDFFKARVDDAVLVGFFDDAAPGNPNHEHIRDLDAPIENGIASHTQS